MSQQAKLRSFFDTVSTRHGHVAIATASVGALTDFLSPIGGWYVSTGLACLCALLLLLVLINRKWVSQKIERSGFLSQWIGGSLPSDISCIQAPAVQYFVIGMLVFGYTSHTTRANADDGGALASNFDQIKNYQSMIGMIAAVQENVRKIHLTVNEIDSTTKSIQEDVNKIGGRLDAAAEADKDPAKQLQKMGTSWDLIGFQNALEANDTKRLGLFLDGGFVYTDREVSNVISSFFESGKFSSHLPGLNYLRSRGVDFVGEFNPNWDEKDNGASSPLGRAALNGSKRGVQWLLDGAKKSALPKYQFVLFGVQTKIVEILEKAADSGLDKYGPKDRAEQLAEIDQNVEIISLMVSRGVDKSHRDYTLYQRVLNDWLNMKYGFIEDSLSGRGGFFGTRLNEGDSLVLADHLKPLLAVLAPPSQIKKSALDKEVIGEYFSNFNRWAIEESESNLKSLAEGRIAYLRNDAEKAAYKSEQENRIRDLKAKRDAIRAGLRV